tara:strand:+ start:496 stop:714 length:219 start_codon:yes stop_codon:yes gene_type:complete
MNFRIRLLKDGKSWGVEQEASSRAPKIIHKANSVLILKDSEAVCETVDNGKDCYILVVGVTKELHGKVMVLK